MLILCCEQLGPGATQQEKMGSQNFELVLTHLQLIHWFLNFYNLIAVGFKMTILQS